MDKYERERILKVLNYKVYRIGKKRLPGCDHIAYIVPNPSLSWTFSHLKQALSMDANGINNDYDLVIKKNKKKYSSGDDNTYIIITDELDDTLIDEFVSNNAYEQVSRTSKFFFTDDYGDEPNADPPNFGRLSVLDFEIIEKETGRGVDPTSYRVLKNTKKSRKKRGKREKQGKHSYKKPKKSNKPKKRNKPKKSNKRRKL